MADAISEDDDCLILQTMNPLKLPEILSMVLSYCDLQGLQTARLVNKTWLHSSTKYIRTKCCLEFWDEDDVKMDRLVQMLADHVRIFNDPNISTFPVTHYKIDDFLEDCPSFYQFFENYGPALIENLEVGVISFLPFWRSKTINFEEYCLSNLKILRIHETYHSCISYRIVNADVRENCRVELYQKLFKLTPNLNKLTYESYLGPSTIVPFITSIVQKLKYLELLCCHLNTTDDSDIVSSNEDQDAIRKRNEDAEIIIHQIPTAIRNLTPWNIKTFGISMENPAKISVHKDFVDGIFEIFKLGQNSLKALCFCVSSFEIHKRHQEKAYWNWNQIAKSFPVLKELQYLSYSNYDCDEPILPNLSLTTKFPKLAHLQLRTSKDNLDKLSSGDWVNMIETKTPNYTVKDLDLQWFLPLESNSDILTSFAKTFPVLKSLQIIINPYQKTANENLVTLFSDFLRLEELLIIVTKEDIQDDEYLEEDEDVENEREPDANDYELELEWNELLTGIPTSTMEQIVANGDQLRISNDELKSLRILPSLVNLKHLRVLQIIDKLDLGIMNDFVCWFALLRMKSLKQLSLASAEQISKPCFNYINTKFEVKMIANEDPTGWIRIFTPC